jgi:hypothetical protein
MKVKYLLLFYILIIIFLSFFPISASAEPKLRFSEEEFDFGFVKEGEVLQHEFTIYNDGNESLEIINVASS